MSRIIRKNRLLITPKFLNKLEGLLQEGVFQCSLEDGIEYGNPSLIKMFGFSLLDEIKTVPFHSLFADEEERIFLFDKINATGSIVDHKILFRRKDGTNFWGLASGRKLTIDNTIFFVGCIQDISELMDAEEQLMEKKQEVQKLSMELDQFIYSASHDIRSPISTTLGIINLMKMDANIAPDDKYVQMLEKSVGKLDYFIQTLAVHAKNSRQQVDDTLIDFNSILNSVFEELSSHSSASLVKPMIEIIPHGVFYSDPERLKIIFRNVILNSLDYIDHSKSQKILSVTISTYPDKATIDIFDNGIGISDVHVNHVFDMFYRGTNLSKGSGLGLYTTREAATKLGGVIMLGSEYGVGTSVKIELPNSQKGKLINKKSMLKSAFHGNQ